MLPGGYISERCCTLCVPLMWGVEGAGTRRNSWLWMEKREDGPSYPCPPLPLPDAVFLHPRNGPHKGRSLILWLPVLPHCSWRVGRRIMGPCVCVCKCMSFCECPCLCVCVCVYVYLSSERLSCCPDFLSRLAFDSYFGSYIQDPCVHFHSTWRTYYYVVKMLLKMEQLKRCR